MANKDKGHQELDVSGYDHLGRIGVCRVHLSRLPERLVSVEPCHLILVLQDLDGGGIDGVDVKRGSKGKVFFGEGPSEEGRRDRDADVVVIDPPGFNVAAVRLLRLLGEIFL